MPGPMDSEAVVTPFAGMHEEDFDDDYDSFDSSFDFRQFVDTDM